MTIDVTVLVALITALAAIIAPVVTSVINAKTSLKLKQMESFEENSNLCITCIADLAKGYSELINNQGYLQPYWNFVTACYKALAQIHDHAIQADLLKLLTCIRENNGKANEDTNQKFDQIMLNISNYLEKSSK